MTAAAGLRVAVAGAGIGGLAAMAAVCRRGVQADLYEQAPELREVGVGLHLGPNGSRLLHRMGLEERLREVAVRPDALEIRNGRDGSLLARQPMGAQWEAEFGAPYYTLHRADLHRMLADLVPREQVHLGRRLVSFAAEPDRVRLAFANGTAAEAGVLVGADGIHSVVRTVIAGEEAPVFSGNSAFRALVPIERLPELPAQTMFIWVGPDSRLLCYPVSAGRLVTFVAVVRDPGWTVESGTTQGDVAAIAAAFSGLAVTVQRTAPAAPAAV